MLDLILKHPEVFPDIDQGRTLIRKFEFNPANIAGIFAPPILEVFNRHFSQSRGLLTTQIAEIQVRIAIGAGM
jgi:hypothetical protein